MVHFVMQLDGKIIAPTSSSAWGSGLLQWIEFTKLTKITIKGKGIIDGQGSVWWKGDSRLPKSKPTVYILSQYVSNNYVINMLNIFSSSRLSDFTELAVLQSVA